MKKTTVQVTVRIEGKGETPFSDFIDECEYFFSCPNDLNADINDTEIVERVEHDGYGFVTVNLTIHHDDDNIDKIINEMDYEFKGDSESEYNIINSEITNYTIVDSR